MRFLYSHKLIYIQLPKVVVFFIIMSQSELFCAIYSKINKRVGHKTFRNVFTYLCVVILYTL